MLGNATATAQAIRMLAAELTTENIPRRGYPPLRVSPVCILVSDGHCTDPPEEYDRAIAELLNLPWGQRAVPINLGLKLNLAGTLAELVA